MPIKLRPATELLEELQQEMDRGRIYEAPLRKAGPHHLEGLCDHGSQTIRINPRPAIVETLLHELLHRRFPRWSERRVEREGRRLLTALDDIGVNVWYRRYQKAKRVSRRSDGLDED